jgi:hypothetical protein
MSLSGKTHNSDGDGMAVERLRRFQKGLRGLLGTQNRQL